MGFNVANATPSMPGAEGQMVEQRGQRAEGRRQKSVGDMRAGVLRDCSFWLLDCCLPGVDWCSCCFFCEESLGNSPCASCESAAMAMGGLLVAGGRVWDERRRYRTEKWMIFVVAGSRIGSKDACGWW